MPSGRAATGSDCSTSCTKRRTRNSTRASRTRGCAANSTAAKWICATRELADRVMAINSYNRVLEELRQKIEQEQHEGHLPAQIGIRLQQSIRRHQTHPDEENAFFRIHFEAIYPGFLERLRKAHPDLTEHELRFCAYLRMGMENKTIAHIRSVQPDSIKKLRFRIRKKLAVDRRAHSRISSIRYRYPQPSPLFFCPGKRGFGNS